MTIPMPDSVRVADLPAGYAAYLGYADGRYANAGELAGRFPDASRIILTVTGNTIDCDGIDIEPGNVNVAAARVWVQRKLAAGPHSRPVIYASVIGQPNYGMHEMIDALVRNRIDLASVRLLSAHYGTGEHICGPLSCKLISIKMGGTQWTDAYRTPSGTIVDMSALAPDFFGETQTETAKIVTELGIVRQGDTGPKVRTVQGLLVARAFALTVDGVFGPKTKAAVKLEQEMAHILADGIVGPQTWPVLLGIA